MVWKQKIRDKPDGLDQGSLRIVQVKHAAKMGQQCIVDDGYKTPGEKQTGKQGHRRTIISGSGRRVVCRPYGSA
jgi:hypothetical protein